jgi:hypothetical protein
MFMINLPAGYPGNSRQNGAKIVGAVRFVAQDQAHLVVAGRGLVN